MRTIKCFWAGQLVQSEDVPDELVDEKVAELKARIKEGTLTFVSCSVTMVLEELCVDIMNGAQLVAMHNFKKK